MVFFVAYFAIIIGTTSSALKQKQFNPFDGLSMPS